MNTILLIGPSAIDQFREDYVSTTKYNPTLGLLSLGTYLDFHGYKTIVMDLCYESSISEKEIFKMIEKENPVFIGLSTYTRNIIQTLTLSRAIKKQFPELKIVLGGPHVSLAPEDGIQSRYIDFVIIKEGEAAILELAEAITSNEATISYDNIPGLVFKRNTQVIKNELRPSITNLDILPIVKRELVGIENYYSVVNVSTSRGCPANCIYCAGKALGGASYRTRDIDNVFLEIVLLKAVMGEKLSMIYIIDDTFTVISNRVYRFIELLQKYDLKIFWRCESRVDVITEELITKMASSGCKIINYGIESGNQQVLNKISKGIDLVSAQNVIDISHKAGILVCLYFMLGHYCDTTETMKETVDLIIELVKKYNVDATLSYNTPFPGTWQYINKEKLGIRMVSDDYRKFIVNEPIVETDNFDIKDQINMFYKAAPFLNLQEFGNKIF